MSKANERELHSLPLWAGVRIAALALLATASACGSEADEAGGSAGNSGAAQAGSSGAAPGGSGGAAQAGASGDTQDGGAGASEDAHVPDAFAEDMPYTGKYAGIEGLTGAALAQALCGIVGQGYTALSYTEARQVVFWQTDIHAGKVLGVYDGFWHLPNDTNINIEHTWPQSKGADTLPPRSDMHHLFPVREDFNSARGNLPFGEVVQRDWPTTLIGDANCTDAMPGNADGCYSFRGKDASGIEVFEPRDGQKGDAARAIFYFSIRYGISCKVKPLAIFDPAHPVITEAVLKKWNLHDPPSAHEFQRNDVIESVEGVRNPFIDHPELVDRISFQ